MSNTQIPPSSQIVLVTGSSRGLGLAIASAFSAAGTRVILNYHTDLSPSKLSHIRSAHATFASLTPNTLPPNKQHLLWKADVTNPSEVEALFSTAQAYYSAPITTVINNAMAGDYVFNGSERKSLAELSWSDFETHQHGFLRAALNTAQSALSHFSTAHFGRLINIGSNLLANPVVPYHEYVAGKGSLLAFTRTCAAELGEQNVNVNMVSAGLLRTTDASAATPEEVFDGIAKMTPLRRVCTPEAVADVVVFLASPGARGVTGQEVVVDGGLVMK